MRLDQSLVDFLAGVVASTYAIAAFYFLKFSRRTKDRLFGSFSAAFALLALNQLVVVAVGSTDERSGYGYILRVLGFLLILVAIVRKNLERRAR